MSNLNKHVRKDKAKWIITAISITLLAIMIITLGVRVFKNETTKTLGVGDYTTGAINENGDILISENYIITEDFNTVDGLTIKLKDNAKSCYKVAFYDKNKDFVSLSESNSTDFNVTNIPDTASYFRIMIIPNVKDGESVKINLLNKATYVNEYEVKFNK